MQMERQDGLEVDAWCDDVALATQCVVDCRARLDAWAAFASRAEAERLCLVSELDALRREAAAAQRLRQDNDAWRNECAHLRQQASGASVDALGRTLLAQQTADRAELLEIKRAVAELSSSIRVGRRTRVPWGVLAAHVLVLVAIAAAWTRVSVWCTHQIDLCVLC